MVRIGPWYFRATLWPTLATCALLPALVWLGMWQLDRADFKDRLSQDYEKRSRTAPLALDSTTMAGESRGLDRLRFRRVSVRGELDEARQFLLDNRVRHGIPGFHVLTLLQTDGLDAGVIVNRGWIALGLRRDRLPALDIGHDIGHDTDRRETTVDGLVMIPPGEAFLVGPSGYEGQGWPRVVQYVDLARMQASLGVRLWPIVVQLDEGHDASLETELAPPVGMPATRHRAYAFQWFSLAVALGVIYVVVNTRKVISGKEDQH